jgi:hypothetical protein
MILVPTQDAVQEFNVASNSISADFGRFEGGVVNLTTKTGANAWHGSAYEYLRNTDLNANNWFNKQNQVQTGAANKPPVWLQNQFGVSASGPIKKDKAFFMFTWEDLKIRMAMPSPTYVPTTAMLAPTYHLPYLYDNNKNLIQVKDPLGNCNPVNDVAGQYWDMSGCASLFPASTQQFLKYWPATNTGTSTYYYRSVGVGNNGSQYNARIDYNLSKNQQIFGRYTYWSGSDIPFNEFPTAQLNDGNGATIYKTHMVVVGDTYTITPSTILDVRASWFRAPNNTEKPVTNANEALWFPGASFTSQEKADLLPQFNLNNQRNFFNAWSRGPYGWSFSSVGQISANLTKIIGRHTLKVGTELRLMVDESMGNDSSGNFDYSADYTGDEWADFLLGYSNDGNISVANSTTAVNRYQAYYVQDNWHATQKLTLNLGLRYELPGAEEEKHDKATVLLPNAVDTTTGITGTLALVNSSLYGNRTLMSPPKNEFAPRLGFAYRFGNDFVTRGGYGLVYIAPNSGGGPGSSPIASAGTAFNNVGPATPLTNPFPNGLTPPYGRTNPSFMTTQLWNQTISGAVPTDPYGYMQQWNFSLSHQMKGDWMVDVGYAGSKGTHLPAQSSGLDQLDRKYWAQAAASNPIVPLTTPLGGYSHNVTWAQSKQPYPYYQNVSDATANWGSTTWHSLQVTTQKRFHSGGLLMASYTWAKMLGDTDTAMGYLEPKASVNVHGGGVAAIQDFTNPRGEHSLLSYNVPQRLVASYVMPLPFGKEKKYFNSLNGAFDSLVSGWALNGITTFQTGFALFLQTAQGNNLASNGHGNNYGAGILRPDYNPSANGCNGKKTMPGSTRARMGEWFNVACFQDPGLNTPMYGWALGNEPRVDGALHSEGIDNWDLSIVKSTRITDRTSFEFRGEFFNIANRVQFGPPYTSEGPVAQTNFGQIGAQVNNPRQVQFSGRFSF